jgi:hypothetical protein
MGILSVEDGSLDIENLEEEGLSPGKVLIHRQGAEAPKLLATGSVPMDFQYEESSLLNEFMNVSGVNDMTRSDYLAKGNISGVALQLIYEQDEVRIQTSIDEIRGAAKDIAKQILRLYKQFAVFGHASRIIGDNGMVELFYWKGSEINSEEIIFETEHEINETLAQKRSMIFDLLKTGLLDNEDGKLSNQTRARILEQLGFGIWEMNCDINSLHKNSASKENLGLVNGLGIKGPLEIDNHEVHINEHIAFMLGGEFEKKVKIDSSLLDKILKHIREHKQLIESTNK